MSVWCWGLTSHQTGRLSNDMWHVPWCHHQRQAPRQMDTAGDWSDYMPFTSPPPLPLSCYSLCSADSWLAGCWQQGLGNGLIPCLQGSPMEHPAWQGPPSTLLQNESHLISPKCHAGKYVPFPPAWPALWAKKPQLPPGKPKLRRSEAVREEEEGSKGFG